jgi:hypothetical protein
MQQILAQVEGWAAEFDRLCGRIAPRFVRPEVRGRVVGFLRGLLATSNARTAGSWPSTRGDHPRWDAAAVDHRPLGR